MRLFFISGTDTDCGKTHITRQLISLFREQGHRTLAVKPLASGVDIKSVNDISSLQTANLPDTRRINLYWWPEAIAPHLAAAKHKTELSAKSIVDFCQSALFHDIDVLCIEGAGGLMVPLNDRETWLDVIKMLNAEVIFVVGMKLGCLNHALLSFNFLQQHKIPCAGWIANCIDPDMQVLEENIETLQKMTTIPCLAINPWQGEMDESFRNMRYNLFLNHAAVRFND